MKIFTNTSLEDNLKQIENHIADANKVNIKVSKATIDWHLDHSLKVINTVLNAIEQSDPTLYKNNFSLLGKFFITINYFPRGKVKAPKYVTPPDVILEKDILLQLSEARNNIQKMQDFDKNAYFKHPLFGHINTLNASKFLNTHTHHHLKIIKAILR